MFYNARWYDPALGRFTQADTVIPGGMQGLDRYAYVNNSPLKFVDPTGHKSCGNMNNNGECDIKEEKLTNLLDYVEKKIARAKGGIQQKYTSLEAMGLVLDKAASIYKQDWNGFLDATTYVFTGYYGHGSEAMWEAHSGDFNGYFEGDSGFHPDFKDGSNQVRHFWAAFATAADPDGNDPASRTTAQLGNWWHDGVTDGIGNDGVTMMDYELSATAIDLASEVGTTKLSPSDLSGLLLNALGPNGGPNYSGPQAQPSWWLTPYN